MTENNWAVFRQDFNSNEFLVEKDLSEERARELVAVYESHGHHQHYWACQIPDEPIDYTEMLKSSLASGSSLEISLKVLRNQNASTNDCIMAVQETRKLEAEEAKRLVMNCLESK